jgi:hypothetical protein
MPTVTNGVSAVNCNAAKCIARQVFNQRTNKLKAKKPFPKMDFKHPDAILHASSNYVWRILCFDLCDFSPHNCLPCTADWDIRQTFAARPLAEREAWIGTLDEAIEQIEGTIPAAEHHGVIRWGSAFDLLNKQIIDQKESV